MTNWKKFEELNREYPESIVEKKIQGFENATDGLASLSLVRLNDSRALLSDISGDFKFELVLHSPILKSYKYKVLSFGYGITFLPINYKLESSIEEELFGDDPMSLFSRQRTLKSTEEFETLLTTIFESNSFDLVVRGLIKVAKRNVE
jgi:hypothetical protein